MVRFLYGRKLNKKVSNKYKAQGNTLGFYVCLAAGKSVFRAYVTRMVLQNFLA